MEKKKFVWIVGTYDERWDRSVNGRVLEIEIGQVVNCIQLRGHEQRESQIKKKKEKKRGPIYFSLF